MTALELKIKIAKEYNEKFDVVEVNGWLIAYIEEFTFGEVITKFYFKNGNPLKGQRMFRKFYTDKKGTYIKRQGQKIYFKF